MATGSVLASTAGYAFADAAAAGSATGSPGVASGNNVQVPIHVPLNVCGNTVNVVGALNPAYGNHCANVSGSGGHPGNGGGGATASGGTTGSPGVGSGNSAQVPVHVPVNACGNSVNVIGVGNPAFGNGCANVHGGTTPPGHPGHPVPPPTGGGGSQVPPRSTHPGTTTPVHSISTVSAASRRPELAHTGAGDLGLYAGAGAVMLAGGALLYRRTRRAVR